jgi:hypothetical protein
MRSRDKSLRFDNANGAVLSTRDLIFILPNYLPFHFLFEFFFVFPMIISYFGIFTEKKIMHYHVCLNGLGVRALGNWLMM